MSLTKAGIVNSISEHCGCSKTQSLDLVESILETIKEFLESGEDILISGFGKFCLKDKNPRRGRNPSTGEDLTLGARKVIIFRCSQVLKRKLNGKG